MLYKETLLERYKEIGDNLTTEKSEVKITKGINAGDHTDSLLLMGIECIGLMTGDFTFSKQNIEKLESRA